LAVTALTEQARLQLARFAYNVRHRGGDGRDALPRAAEHVLHVAALGRRRAIPAVAFKEGYDLTGLHGVSLLG
jgi:hypothetical protein